MRRPPAWTEFRHYPVITTTLALATSVSAIWWCGKDISPLLENAALRHGQLWRLLTSTLAHVNILHLAFNLYWLWVFGTLIENVYGRPKTLGILLLLAAGSSAAEYALLHRGVGLSGVVYGLFGLLWAVQSDDPRFAGAINAKTSNLFVGWFFLCIFTTITNIMPVGNVAHGAGAVLGALLGTAIVARPLGRKLAGFSLTVLIAASLIGATIARRYVNLSRSGYEQGLAGYEALKANRYDEAVQELLQAIRLNPKEITYWQNLGIAFSHLGKHAQALEAYQTALRESPYDREIQAGCAYEKVWMGYEALDAGRNAQAVDWYWQATQLVPGNASYWHGLAIAYERQGKQAEAISAYGRAHRLEPNDATYKAGYERWSESSKTRDVPTTQR